MSNTWVYDHVTEPKPYGGDATYRMAARWLNFPGWLVEDWGCGTAYARRFYSLANYRGIDGSTSAFVDQVSDLKVYRSTCDGVVLRHVLEHNWEWRTILGNAFASATRRVVLVFFTPEGETELDLAPTSPVPDLVIPNDAVFEEVPVEWSLAWYGPIPDSQTQYGVERMMVFDRVVTYD